MEGVLALDFGISDLEAQVGMRFSEGLHLHHAGLDLDRGFAAFC